ncbi:C-terminal binding protein [Inquilinus sp. Marseille-Q2685]|uniref:C-terminal binding protein n=1 Tax=Inquilinus sp. Marseille-Q2685 TaxID=2866581 RepID=UPI001CE3FAC1|nr:C-terminal binding protein [Inquilinus sp. Marseille-Q2685]
MAPRFTILTPDAQYADDAVIERQVGGADVEFVIRRERDRKKIPDEVYARADALLTWHELKVDQSVIDKMPRCRIIVRAGVGFDHIDLAAAGAAGIPVANTPDYGTSEVADHAIGLMLALLRGIPAYDQALQADPAGRYTLEAGRLTRRIRGTRLGIVGLGRIGTAMAMRARAFGLEILAYDPYIPRGQEIALGITRVEILSDLLAASDIVSIHAPLTPETHRLFGDAAFSVMRPHAVLINTARGAIVDLDALHGALQAGRIAGAALDVLPEEPPPEPLPALLAAYREQPEWLRGRLILTPHAAWSSPESQADARRLSAETTVAYLRSGALRNCVNEAFLDRKKLRR